MSKNHVVMFWKIKNCKNKNQTMQSNKDHNEEMSVKLGEDYGYTF